MYKQPLHTAKITKKIVLGNRAVGQTASTAAALFASGIRLASSAILRWWWVGTAGVCETRKPLAESAHHCRRRRPIVSWVVPSATDACGGVSKSLGRIGDDGGSGDDRRRRCASGNGDAGRSVHRVGIGQRLLFFISFSLRLGRIGGVCQSSLLLLQSGVGLFSSGLGECGGPDFRLSELWLWPHLPRGLPCWRFPSPRGGPPQPGSRQ